LDPAFASFVGVRPLRDSAAADRCWSWGEGGHGPRVRARLVLETMCSLRCILYRRHTARITQNAIGCTTRWCGAACWMWTWTLSCGDVHVRRLARDRCRGGPPLLVSGRGEGRAMRCDAMRCDAMRCRFRARLVLRDHVLAAAPCTGCTTALLLYSSLVTVPHVGGHCDEHLSSVFEVVRSRPLRDQCRGVGAALQCSRYWCGGEGVRTGQKRFRRGRRCADVRPCATSAVE